MNELEQAIYSRLAGGTALTTKLGGTAIYNAMMPRGSSYPAVVFGHQGGGDANQTPRRSKNVLYTIKAVSNLSMKAAGEVDALIDDLMHEHTLTVAGWDNYWTMREQDVRFVETTAEGSNFWHVGGIYRIRLCE